MTMLSALNPYLIGGAALAVIASGGVGYLKGHEHATTAAEAQRAATLEASNQVLSDAMEKNAINLAAANREALRINELLDDETEAANMQAANLQDRIDGIENATVIDVNCPPVRYDGLYELYADIARGRPADIDAVTSADPASVPTSPLSE